MVQGSLDTPIAHATVAASAELMLGGWVCDPDRGGQQPFALKVRYTNGASVVEIPTVVRYNALSRPDVQAALGLPQAFVGYEAVIPAGTLPAGPTTLSLEWADAWGAHYDQVSIVVQ